MTDESARRGRCAYCDTAAPLTREHLFSDFLNRGSYRTFVDRTRNVVTRRAPTIRDVCRPCNNGPLSQLDGYGAELHRRHFSHLVGVEVDVTFTYDYDRLLRWLLKVSFNHDRTRGHAVEPYLPLRPYVLGTSPRPATQVSLHLGIIAAVDAGDTGRARVR